MSCYYPFPDVHVEPNLVPIKDFERFQESKNQGFKTLLKNEISHLFGSQHKKKLALPLIFQ